MEETKTFIFSEKNGNAVITLSDESYDQAWDYLTTLVKDYTAWRCENLEGEEE